MNVLFLTLSSFNNITDRGIYSDLLRQFQANGHQIYIVNPRQKRTNLPTEHMVMDGVNYLKVRVGNITQAGKLEKGLATIRIESQFLKEIKKHFSDVKFDLVMYSTPPITFEKVVRYIKNRDEAKTYLLLKDIFPQNAVDLEMFSKKGQIHKVFRRKEKRLYQLSDYIGCMSQANVDYVLKHNPGLSQDKVEVCPNSIEPVVLNVDKKAKEDTRNKYGIPQEKTIFLYGGNLGKPQGVDFIIEVLRANTGHKEAHFLIIGSGTEFVKVKAFVDKERPTNVQLLNHLPKEEYDVLANSCDVGLIFLDHRFTIPNFPSRLLSYLQASMPVLAATDPNTDIGKVIESGKFGLWCESSDVEAFNRLVNAMCDPKTRTEMGANARKYLLENYTSRHSYDIIMRHFSEKEETNHVQ